MKIYPIVITLLVAADTKRDAKGLAYENLDDVIYGTMDAMYASGAEPAGIVDYMATPIEDGREQVERKAKNMERLIAKAVKGDD